MLPDVDVEGPPKLKGLALADRSFPLVSAGVGSAVLLVDAAPLVPMENEVGAFTSTGVDVEAGAAGCPKEKDGLFVSAGLAPLDAGVEVAPNENDDVEGVAANGLGLLIEPEAEGVSADTD